MAVTVGIIHLFAGITAQVDYILFLAGFFWAGLALGMIFSIYFADFRWENPNRMLRVGGLFLYLSSVAGIIVPFGVIAVFAGEIFPGIVDPGLLITILSAFFIIISILISLRKLSNYEWDAKV